jgi:lysozyme
MKISQNCLDIIKKWEGFRLDAYLDPVNIPTIGYGTIRFPDGQKVKMGDKISEPEAEAFLKFEVDKMVKALNTTLSGINLNQNQFDAVVSLCYNIGVGAFQGSTVLKKLRTGEFAEAAAAFGRWNKGTINGVKQELKGLTNRRLEERQLFEKGDSQGEPIEVEDSPQDSVDTLKAYNNGENNVIVAMKGAEIVEILVLKSSLKEDFISLIQQYQNAKSFTVAKKGEEIPKGTPVDVVGKAAEIPKADKTPELNRKLLVLGVSDDDAGAAGSDVKELQQRLLDLGYYEGKIDGIFGRATDDAVRSFQAETMGTAEADGKVGKITWGKLWGSDAPKEELSQPTGDPVPGKNYLLLTKTNQKDTTGCFKLKLEYIKDGLAKDSLVVVSGTPKRQFFRTGKDSRRGSFEPLPEGKWTIHSPIMWKGGSDVYDRNKVWETGIGPVKILLDYVPVDGTRRGNIEIHLDWNKSTNPGTAGCIGVNTISDFQRLVGWLRETDPRELYVDWGLDTVKLP